MYASGVFPVGFSDHCAIYAVRKLHQVKRPPPEFIKATNYKLFDSKLFNGDLHHIPWDVLEFETNSEDTWNRFKGLFMTVADKHAPVTKKPTPWITMEIKDLMRQRDCHHKKAISSNQ